MDTTQAVARNLKKLRETRNLSLDGLARLTGVSKSMLGQIERGAVNPTISMVWKIAVGLKVSFMSLLETEREEVTLLRETDVEALVEDEGRYVNYPLFPYEEGRPFELYRIDILPSGGLEAAPHLPDTEEYLTVYAGEAVVLTAGGEYRLKRGDSLRFRADAPHAYRNEGTETAVLNMVIYYPA